MNENVDKKVDKVRVRSETDSGSSPEEPPTKKNPSYGSQKYWEDRYTSHLISEQKETEENSPEAFHSWYFTYEDLSPLLLPLILGDGKDDELEDDESAADQAPTVAAEANRDEESLRKGKKEDSQGRSSKRHARNTITDRDYSRDVDDSEKHKKCALVEYSECDADNDHGNTTFEDNVEILDEDDASENDDSEQPGPREGLSKSGAISVLEVGCGDVPLGRDLARSIESFESQTGIASNNILKQVVCVDYAPSCIESLKKEQKKESDQRIQLSFEVGDARKLKYKNESFQLILEKGTMDAMLSDADQGVDNCKLIVAESARILTTGGKHFFPDSSSF